MSEQILLNLQLGLKASPGRKFMIDLLWKTQGRPTSQRYAFILQEKPRSGTREISLIVKLETIVNFSLERFLYILKKERTQESFLRSKGFFLLHYRKRGRQHVCKDPDSFWGGVSSPTTQIMHGGLSIQFS